jgi:hypothetical protein
VKERRGEQGQRRIEGIKRKRPFFLKVKREKEKKKRSRKQREKPDRQKQGDR